MKAKYSATYRNVIIFAIWPLKEWVARWKRGTKRGLLVLLAVLFVWDTATWPLSLEHLALKAMLVTILFIFYQRKLWLKIDKALLEKLIDLIVVEVWQVEGMGWFRYCQAVSLSAWMKEHRVSVNLELIKRYFQNNWLAWNGSDALPIPVSNDDYGTGHAHPLDLISALSELREEE